MIMSQFASFGALMSSSSDRSRPAPGIGYFGRHEIPTSLIQFGCPLNDIEIKYILEAYGESTYKRILNINPLLLNIKDILRNRVEILKKKYYKSL